MATPSPIARLTDIIEAIELICSEMAGVTLTELGTLQTQELARQARH